MEYRIHAQHNTFALQVLQTPLPVLMVLCALLDRRPRQRVRQARSASMEWLYPVRLVRTVLLVCR